MLAEQVEELFATGRTTMNAYKRYDGEELWCPIGYLLEKRGVGWIPNPVIEGDFLPIFGDHLEKVVSVLGGALDQWKNVVELWDSYSLDYEDKKSKVLAIVREMDVN